MFSSLERECENEDPESAVDKENLIIDAVRLSAQLAGVKMRSLVRVSWASF